MRQSRSKPHVSRRVQTIHLDMSNKPQTRTFEERLAALQKHVGKHQRRMAKALAIGDFKRANSEYARIVEVQADAALLLDLIDGRRVVPKPETLPVALVGPRRTGKERHEALELARLVAGKRIGDKFD